MAASGIMLPTQEPVLESASHLQGSVHPGPARFYRPELDALRFFAFLVVFMCHGLPFAGADSLQFAASRSWQLMQVVRQAGNFGVCLFFVLSSFLITELLRREFDKTKGIDVVAFYVRRTLRIWPLYFFVIFTTALLGLFVPQLHMRIGQLLANAVFLGNWYLIASTALAVPLSWLWSISVEEQFYIMWPLMGKLGGMRCILIGSILLIPLSIVAMAWGARFQIHQDTAVWLNSATQFQFFGLGALLAFALMGRLPRFSKLMRVSMFLVGGLSWIIASGVCQIKTPDAHPGAGRMIIGYELVALGCLLFFLSILNLSTRHIAKPIIYLGRISYGLYVYHGLALLATTSARKAVMEHLGPVHSSVSSLMFIGDRLLGFCLTIALAMLSYKYLESPFLRLKRRFTVVESRIP